MKLNKLLKDVKYLKIIGNENLEIDGIYNDYKEIKPNGLFFCIQGNTDGTIYVKDAIARKAVCIVTETRVCDNITQVIVKDCRVAMAEIAKAFYNNSSDKLKIISIVGTNGKTTTSYLINNILKQKYKTGLIGTNGAEINKIKMSCKLTTPDPIDLHYYFSQMVNQGVEIAIIEASAHAIKLNKLHGINSEVAVFTNITNEHLDFFENMKDYSNTKLKFFDKNVKHAVINSDDVYGQELIKKFNGKKYTYGLYNPAETFALDIETTLRSCRFIIKSLDDVMEITTSLIGEYNVLNILAAVTTSQIFKMSAYEIANGINSLSLVEGRFNLFGLNEDNKVIVDFAHTPDGIEKVLSIIKKLNKGKIITVFGCVGYSDSNKRKLMGQAAARFSDFVILTADNPDFQDVFEINKDIKKGFNKKTKFVEIENRENAINYGKLLLTNNDCLVLLGKGAETSQKINGIKVAYSDIDVVKKIIKEEGNKMLITKVENQ